MTGGLTPPPAHPNCRSVVYWPQECWWCGSEYQLHRCLAAPMSRCEMVRADQHRGRGSTEQQLRDALAAAAEGHRVAYFVHSGEFARDVTARFRLSDVAGIPVHWAADDHRLAVMSSEMRRRGYLVVVDHAWFELTRELPRISGALVDAARAALGPGGLADLRDFRRQHGRVDGVATRGTGPHTVHHSVEDTLGEVVRRAVDRHLLRVGSHPWSPDYLTRAWPAVANRALAMDLPAVSDAPAAPGRPDPTIAEVRAALAQAVHAVAWLPPAHAPPHHPDLVPGDLDGPDLPLCRHGNFVGGNCGRCCPDCGGTTAALDPGDQTICPTCGQVSGVDHWRVALRDYLGRWSLTQTRYHTRLAALDSASGRGPRPVLGLPADRVAVVPVMSDAWTAAQLGHPHP